MTEPVETNSDFVAKHYKLIRSLTYKHFLNRIKVLDLEAEDLIQEACCKLLRYGSHDGNDATLNHYLRKVISNCLFDMAFREQRHREGRSSLCEVHGLAQAEDALGYIQQAIGHFGVSERQLAGLVLEGYTRNELCRLGFKDNEIEDMKDLVKSYLESTGS